ncbi:MAG: hypothetical protein HY098_09300 [Nitrospinae bacterium]|nr:hypothetical protein [Nitrospinota bacterium]
MSAFLGPIHYMMFNKIKIASDRSRFILEAFREKHGQAVNETLKSALPDGLVDFGDAPLDELLGDNPIHQFLQGLIDHVETAEATLVTALLYRFPDDAETMLEEKFFEHGRLTGEKLVKDRPNAAPLTAFQQVVGSNYLEGMPCDQVSSYRMLGKESLEVTHSDCLHRAKWEEAGAPTHVMCKLMDKWVEGCARAVSPGLTIKRIGSILDGATECRCTVSLPAN